MGVRSSESNFLILKSSLSVHTLHTQIEHQVPYLVSKHICLLTSKFRSYLCTLALSLQQLLYYEHLNFQRQWGHLRDNNFTVSDLLKKLQNRFKSYRLCYNQYCDLYWSPKKSFCFFLSLVVRLSFLKKVITSVHIPFITRHPCLTLI